MTTRTIRPASPDRVGAIRAAVIAHCYEGDGCLRPGLCEDAGQCQRGGLFRAVKNNLAAYARAMGRDAEAQSLEKARDE